MEKTRAAKLESAIAARLIPARMPVMSVPAIGTSRRNTRLVLVALSAALAFLLAFTATNFFLFQLTLAMIFAIAILGLNLLTGFNGQFSLGHSAFFAIGAYTAAILMEHGGVPYYWTLPAAAVVCLISGFLFGLPALRLEGIYLALATFALAVATPQLLKSRIVADWTGGVMGIVLLKPAAPFGLPFNPDQWLFLFTVAVAIVMYLCAGNLVTSRTGRAMMAIRDNPIAAKSMGINTSLYKSLTFGVSALYTGVAGALSAIAIQFVSPDSFTFVLAIVLFVGMVIGGVGWIPGTLFGGLFVLFVPHFAEYISHFVGGGGARAQGLVGVMNGIILILVVYVMPSGMAGLARWMAVRLGRIS